MSVKIRMSRGGTKKRPYYSIVVIDSRKARDGRSIETVGSYNPMLQKDNPERVKLNVERIKHWISKGAQPSERVALFIFQAGFGEKPEIRNKPIKSAPKAKAQERLKAAAEAAAKPAEAAPAAEETAA